MGRYDDYHLHEVCYNTFVTDQMIHECVEANGIECATKVDDEQEMTAFHILCASPHCR